MRAEPAPAQTRLVFITGASSGIGLALAARYIAQGWQVALVARRTQLMAEEATRRGWPTAQWRAYAADVAQPDTVIAAATRCMDEWGLPDVVIANAGISIGIDPAERADLDVLARILDTNVMGLAATLQPFIAPMRTRGHGRLVGIASVAGVRGLPGHAAYSASKAAVIAYCESVRASLRGSGVRMVTLSPGYVATPLTSRNRFPMPFLLSPEAFAQRAIRIIAAGARHRVIPWPMALVACVLRLLPAAVFDAALALHPPKHRGEDG